MSKSSTKPPSSRRFVANSLRHHRRIHFAVALGVATATAVLTGALLVGDSVRGSLRQTALGRLGSLSEVLVTDKFFREELASQLLDPDDATPDALPAIVLQGSVTKPPRDAKPRDAKPSDAKPSDAKPSDAKPGDAKPDTKTHASQVTFYGTTEAITYFQSRGRSRYRRYEPTPTKEEQAKEAEKNRLKDDEVYLNGPLAKELGAEVGDEVILRLSASRDVSEESPLGDKTDTVANTPRLKIRAILPTDDIAGVSLSPNQQITKNAFVTLRTLQKAIEKPGKANAVLVGRSTTDDVAELKKHQALLTSRLRPTLADYGLKWEVARPGYFNLTSDRMLFDPATARAALETYKEYDPQPVFTYLANTIALGKKEIPYSTVAAMDIAHGPTLGPLRAVDGTDIDAIADDEIVLTRWAADDLEAQPGDTIRLVYFQPESTHTDIDEAEATFKLKAVAALAKENDPLISAELTPELKGVTDQLKMNDWDPPFPYEAKRIRETDEDYWDDYKATPKAFVSAATGKRLWSSRFGEMTSLRIAPRPGLTVETLAAKFRPDPASLGFTIQPIKLRAIEAASGTTPFEGLFIGFSFFIIAAAVMLTSLLFRLGIEQRATEIGVLLAVGLGIRKVRRLLLAEGFFVAAIGGAIGIALGVGYAWLMLAGLRTLWLDAVTVPFLELFVTAKSLAIGYLIGVLVSLATIAWSLRALRKLPVRRLLAGQASESDAAGNALSGRSRRFTWSALLLWGGLVLAVASVAAATKLSDEAQVGAFFGSAAFVLIALLALTRRRLAAARFGSLVETGRGRVAVLAVRNAGRNPGRSTLTIGLVAAAAFLIVAVSAFRIAPPSSYTEPTGGTGGFALVAQSDLPILADLSTEEGRTDLNFSQAQIKALGDAKAFPCRFKPGDDASCLNLYQTERPRVVGLSDSFVRRGGFSWAGNSAESPEEKTNPWLLLERKNLEVPAPSGYSPAHYHGKEGIIAIPIVLDQATAVYSLHLSGVGDLFNLQDAAGRTIVCRVVGLLKNSVLQGSVLMSEANFKRCYPEVSGYRFFLLEAPPERADEVGRTLETGLEDFGFDVQSSVDLLAGFLAVQNTYLSTFQTLGGLGLLLGTFGLAVVQLRNVLERRGELALLRAVGLKTSLLGRLVFWENVALLVGGLGCGAIAAAVAVVPHAVMGNAGIPWAWLGGTLGAVLLVGLATGAVVVRRVVRMPILAALRGE